MLQFLGRPSTARKPNCAADLFTFFELINPIHATLLIKESDETVFDDILISLEKHISSRIERFYRFLGWFWLVSYFYFGKYYQLDNKNFTTCDDASDTFIKFLLENLQFLFRILLGHFRPIFGLYLEKIREVCLYISP